MSKAQLRNCGNKRRFASRAEALRSIADKKLDVYVCPVCTGFHLTSQVKAARASGKAPRDVEKPAFDGSVLARARWKRS